MPEQKPVFETVKEILVDALGVDEAEVQPGARLISDLGAESIDMLDISFRLEETYGISLPTKEWTDLFSSHTGQLATTELADRLHADYGITLTASEIESHADQPLRRILDAVESAHGIVIPPERRLEYARLGTEELLDRFGDLMLSSIEGEERRLIVLAASECGFDENFWNAVSTTFTVDRIVRFVERRLAAAGEQAA